jgi:pimeloyl-ACP methyl ester carboxylesterase
MKHLLDRLAITPSKKVTAMNALSRNSTGTATARQPDSHSVGYFDVGSGAPVVMLHSSLSSKGQWGALAERLIPGFRAIAIDLHGYGDHSPVEHEVAHTLDDEVRPVVSIVDRLIGRRGRVHLVGHSFGGLVALRLARWLVGRVASVSLFEPVAFRLLDDEDPALHDLRAFSTTVRERVRAGYRHEAARVFVDFWNGHGGYVALPPPVRESMARRIGKVLLDFEAAWDSREIIADVQGLTAPTLLLAGDCSPTVTRRVHARLAALLPRARVGNFDCGHMGPITDAQIINTWIGAFLEDCERQHAVSLLATSRPRVASVRNALEPAR